MDFIPLLLEKESIVAPIKMAFIAAFSNKLQVYILSSKEIEWCDHHLNVQVKKDPHTQGQNATCPNDEFNENPVAGDCGLRYMRCDDENFEKSQVMPRWWWWGCPKGYPWSSTGEKKITCLLLLVNKYKYK